VTLFRTRLIPFVLATALFALGGCGLFFEEGPTEATLVTVKALQGITDAIAGAVMPEEVGGDVVSLASGSMAGGGQRFDLTTITFPGETDPTCIDGGSLALTGDVYWDDKRVPDTALGTIDVDFTNLSTVVSGCKAYGYTSDGTLTAAANDLITVTDGSPDYDEHWQVQQNESASGNLTIMRGSTGATYNSNFSWLRMGTLQAGVIRGELLVDVTLLSRNHTLYLSVNGQSCTATYTGSILSGGYDWDC